MIVNSIRGRIQLWHTALLTVLMAGLLSAFYFHEKEIREREFDQKLMAPLSSAIPHFGADAGLHPAPGSQEQRNASMQANQRGPRPMQGDAMHQPPQSMDRPEGMRPPPPGMRRPRGPLGMPEGGEREAMYGPPNRMAGSHSQGTHGELGQTVGPKASVGAMQLSLEERQAKELPGIMDLGFYIASVTNEGKIVHSSPNVRENISYPSHLIEDGRQSTFLRTENGYREAIHRGPGPAYSIVLIGAPTAMMYAELAILRWQLLGIGITIVILGYIIGWILAGRALKPIQSISQTAAQISAGNLSQRIDLNETESELGQMGEVLNDTFSKLDSAFEQQVRFTADASHELRTPIAVILAKCQFALMRDREPEKYVAALKTCEASAQHIRGLVESLLELARIDSGEFKIKTTPCDLSETAAHTVDMLNTLAEAKNIRLTLQHDSVPAVFDSSRIHQVATNLIGNAIKYTQEGGTIDVHVHGQGSFAVMEVRDTGPGIEPKHIPHLFDRFYRSSSERSDDRRSTGLGLAITKAIVDAHKGQIVVDSELGKGSCFTVRLPA